jgi:hypothetical protein
MRECLPALQPVCFPMMRSGEAAEMCGPVLALGSMRLGRRVRIRRPRMLRWGGRE